LFGGVLDAIGVLAINFIQKLIVEKKIVRGLAEGGRGWQRVAEA
jgi:hypothetical protein